MTLFGWVFELAQGKLADALPSRWRHVQGVARQARNLRLIAGSDVDLLEAAAILHDVGYVPDIAQTGFHPLDGADYLLRVGAPVRLVHLVAHHSYAQLEAGMRELSDEIAEYTDERGSLRDALWFCDLTTGPNCERVDARDRISEIQQRYGPDHLATQFITQASPELLAAVDRTELRLTAVSTG